MNESSRRTVQRLALAALALLLAGGCGGGPRPAAGAADSRLPQRIVSLVPSVTETLFAIGAGPRVVGVGSFDRNPPQATRLPRVGGLLDPDLERIVALRPDLVVLYATQTDLRAQLDRMGIAVFPYSHASLADVLQTIRDVGTGVGRPDAARRLAATVDARLEAVRRRVAGAPRPRTMLVFERESSSLRTVYASGGVGFLADILDLAGGHNVFADVRRESLQVSTEAILGAAPEVIIELRPGAGPPRTEQADAAWQALAAVPAVAHHRVYVLTSDEFVVPGPRVADAADWIARVLHGGEQAGPGFRFPVSGSQSPGERTSVSAVSSREPQFSWPP